MELAQLGGRLDQIPRYLLDPCNNFGFVAGAGRAVEPGKMVKQPKVNPNAVDV
jgi:hypothetical protein